MFAAMCFLGVVVPGLLALPAEPLDLTVSGAPLPSGAVARFGVAHPPYPKPFDTHACGYSDEGSFRMAVADGNEVRVWTWHGSTAVPPKHLLTGHAEPVVRLVLSADGRTLAGLDRAGDVRAWDLVTGETILATRTEPKARTLAASVRGRWVFIPAKDGFGIWDTATGKRVATAGAGRTFVAAGFSPDAKSFATADDKGKLDLWETATAKHIGELPWDFKPVDPKGRFDPFGVKLGPGGKPELPKRQKGLYHSVHPSSPEHDGGVIRIVFTADGERVLAAGASVVRAWDVATRKELWMSSHSHYFTMVGGATAWTTDSGALSGMDVSPDGKLVAATTGSGVLWLIDAATGKDIRSLTIPTSTGPRHEPPGVTFHPNGKWVCTHHGANVATLWDIRTGVAIATTGGHNGRATAIAFSPDGAYLAGYGDDWHIDVFDLKRGAPTGRAHAGAGTGTGFGWTANGKYLVTGGVHIHGRFQVVEFTPGSRVGLRALNPRDSFGEAEALCIDPRDPARIITARKYGTITGTELPEGKPVGVLTSTQKEGLPLNDDLSEIALAADANLAVVSFLSYARRPIVVDLKTGKLPVTLEEAPPSRGAVHGARVAITSDGKRIAAIGQAVAPEETTRVRVWDGETGKVVFEADYPKVYAGGLGFSRDGKLLAAGIGGDVLVFDATGKEVARAKGHRGTVTGVAFSADGARLASCAADGQVLLWDVAKITAAGR